MAIDLYINTEARSLETAIVTGTKRPTESARIREFVQGADQDYILHLINADGSYDSRSGDEAVAMRVGVSVRGGTAKTGKFTLTAGAITSEAISFGASASALEAALNRMNSGAGPYSDKVKAQKLGDGMWLIIFDTAGAQDALAAESLNLFPESGVIPNLYVTGTPTIRCQQIIRVARQPAIYSETWTAAGTTFTGTLDASTARVSQLLNDDSSAQVVFEVKADDTILCSVPCRILPAVADTSSFTGASLPTPVTEAYVTAAIADAALPASSVSTFGGTLIDDPDAATARATLGVDAAGTDNSTDVTLGGAGTYISIAGQVITVDPITESDISDLGAYITGITGEPLSDLSDVTITSIASGELLKWNGSAWINQTLAEAGVATAAQGSLADSAVQSTDIDTLAELNAIVGDATLIDTGDFRLSDARTPTAHTHTASEVTDFDIEVANNSAVTANTAKLTADTTNVTAAGALMDSEVTNLAQVKAFDTTDYATAAQGSLADSAVQSTDIDTIAELNAVVTDATILTTATGYTQAAADAAITASLTLIGNTIFVAKTGTDTRTGLDDHDIRKPFLTVNAAQAVAGSGDTIMVFAGDYSAETALGGVDGVYYQGMDGATLPAFNVTTGITVYGSGLAQSLTCNHASAMMNFARMDAVTLIYCDGGMQTAGNAGTLIYCDGGVQTAGNAGTYIACEGGEQTAGNAGTYIICDGGMQTAGNAGTYIYCLTGGEQTAGNAGTYIICGGGVQTAGNAGTYIGCAGGVQTVTHANLTSTDRPVRLLGSGSLTITGRIESTESGGVVVDIANSWSGSLKLVDCNLTATTVATNEATKGINYGTSVTGDVQLKNCTLITAQNGNGTARAIASPSAQTIYLQTPCASTHDAESTITPTGADLFINPNFTA